MGFRSKGRIFSKKVGTGVGFAVSGQCWNSKSHYVSITLVENGKAETEQAVVVVGDECWRDTRGNLDNVITNSHAAQLHGIRDTDATCTAAISVRDSPRAAM